ncbi:MAG: FkbM family methyltransferase [Acidobacteriia bacterium]|nr:FkbM family methyltransferase [Terriglobia bacterium]
MRPKADSFSIKEAVRRCLPRTIKGHCILRGRLRGSVIVTSWHDYPGAILGRTERPLLEWFLQNVSEGDTWLDVGAHYGFTAIALSRLTGNSGRVLAFEPVLSSAACILKTREANHLHNLTIIPVALDDRGPLQTVQMPSVRGMVDSTIPSETQHEQILTASLDVIWPSLCGADARVDGIKIDVQGMECQVLSGMRNVLKRWSPKLVVEFHAGVNRNLILDFLGALGYSTKPEPIDSDQPTGLILDDHSYAFNPLGRPCESLSTQFSTRQN